MSVEDFVERHIDLAESIASTYRRRTASDPNDITSDALWGLHEAAKTYDSARGTTERTWVGQKVRWTIADGIRQRTGRTEHGPRRTLVLSLDEPLLREDSEITLADVLAAPGDLIGRVEDAVDISRFLRLLPAKQRYILTRTYMHQDTITEVSGDLGVTHPVVSVMRARARERLQRIAA